MKNLSTIPNLNIKRLKKDSDKLKKLLNMYSTNSTIYNDQTEEKLRQIEEDKFIALK